MTPTLSDAQRQALAEHAGAAVVVLDAATTAKYVLMPAEEYEKVKAILGASNDINPKEAYPAIDRVFAQDWDDPAMDLYDDYDAHRAPK